MVSCAPGTVNIVEFGADTSAENNAEAIDKAIAAVAKGGTVVVPSGVFLSSTVHLKSNITLHLDEGATIKGVDDPGAYDSYIPTKDMSRYDSGAGTLNSNVSSDAAWNRALVLGVGVENVSITGPGGFDGSHVFDSTGEEHMRGPHTILFAESRNLLPVAEYLYKALRHAGALALDLKAHHIRSFAYINHCPVPLFSSIL
mgnify:CR=1 FL=1